MSFELKVLTPGFDRHRRTWAACTRCEIGRTAFRHVFARGTVPCDVLFIGEAPGKTEDATGFPFIGKSGRLLDEWILDSQAASPAGYTYAITNTVCCRPCDFKGGPNRAPSLQEKRNCWHRLMEFFNVAKPRAVVLVGKHAQAITFPPNVSVCQIYHPMAAIYSGGRGGRIDLEQRARLRAFIQRESTSWQRLPSAV